MQAWRELAVPHQDVLKGTFKQSEFAADLTQVVSGKATAEYQNAQKFYRRTFITAGMQLLLRSVAQRLSGKGGDPVIQLQTAFGGGKTHAMLAVYHLATRNCALSELQGISDILNGLHDLPKAKVAVIDGNNIAPNEIKKRDAVKVNTLWGELAWQLCGAAGYEMVSLSDQSGASPGKEILVDLLHKASPCVVLIDELVAYVRQFEEGKSYRGGTFASNMSFVQALTEACKAVPKAVLLASLPESEMEAAGARGREALAALEKFFGRVEAVWKPVGAEEAFAIVKRRLFEDLQDKQVEIKNICEEVHSYYRKRNHKDKFPQAVVDSSYLERLINCYPIHPEVFDRLYEDWSTLDKFQRTRGVLQFLAIVIYKLWDQGNQEPLIMPSSIPLNDTEVRTQLTRYLSGNWDAIIDSEIDSIRAKAHIIDNKEPRFGKLSAAKKTARTIFIGTAPSASNHSDTKRHSLSLENILLGACMPNDAVAPYEDVLQRLTSNLHYLSQDTQGYHFDTRPNLRREVESRQKRFNEEEHLKPAIKNMLRELLKGTSLFTGVHIFCATDDVPDDHKLRLVVPTYSRDVAYTQNADNSMLEAKADEFLHKRGSQVRQYRNSLLFLVANRAALQRLKDNSIAYLAWQSIVDDINNKKINLDMYHIEQAKQECDKAARVFKQTVREAWQWLMTPLQEHDSDSVQDLEWDCVKIDTGKEKLLAEITDKAKDEEWVIGEWSAPNLTTNLQRYYFKDNQDVEITKIFHDMASFVYFQRLQDENVLCETIRKGVMNGDFGYAVSKEGEQYRELSIGKPPLAVRIEGMLVQSEVARAQQGEASIVSTEKTSHTDEFASMPASTRTEAKKRFHAAVSVQPQRARLDFSKIAEEVLTHLVEDSLCAVEISIDIAASHRDGFSHETQRTLKENCRALDFNHADFEEE